jgi:hypothetical protein
LSLIIAAASTISVGSRAGSFALGARTTAFGRVTLAHVFAQKFCLRTFKHKIGKVTLPSIILAFFLEPAFLEPFFLLYRQDLLSIPKILNFFDGWFRRA